MTLGTWKNAVWHWRNRTAIKPWHITKDISHTKTQYCVLSNPIYSSISWSPEELWHRTREAGAEACWSWSKPQVWRLESINPATAGWRTGCALQYGSEKERFPCWCVLIRLELVGPATACLMPDLERRDYLLQLLSSLLPLLMPPLLKGQVTFALSFTRHDWVIRYKGVSQPTRHRAGSKPNTPNRE